MVALPDFESGFSASPRSADALSAWPVQRVGLARLGLRLAGAGLVAAAVGLWVLPSHAADPAMMLVKLLVSITLFCAGSLGLLATRGWPARQEVQIDHAARELRVLTRGANGTRQVAAHRLDDLLELSLRDGLLSARDRSGRLVVSLDVAEGRDERALREALLRTA